jgi:hypothetical protein
MKTITVIHDATRGEFEADVLDLRPGRVMILVNGASEEVRLPIASTVQIIMGDEIWLAELIGRCPHGDSVGVVADVFYRLTKDENRIRTEERCRQQPFCDRGSRQSRMS